ncbi:MAG: YfhO family protein, partial [Lachnospiraceae bacterium]|nr:YfhO family protein [Lachnospiraceae bacterium]
DYPGQVYVYVDCIDCDSILVNSEGRTFMPAPGEAGFTDLGYLEKGSKVEVTINAGQGGVTGNVYVATLDEDVFEKDFMLLKKGGLHGMEWTGTSLSGTADVPEDSTMLTTFSYDRGWTVFVDGVKTPAYSVDSSFLAFDVGSGNHRIEMYYVPAGFRPGLMLTLLSVLGCCAWMYRKKKSEVKRAAGIGSGVPDTGENGEQEKEDP